MKIEPKILQIQVESYIISPSLFSEMERFIHRFLSICLSLKQDSLSLRSARAVEVTPAWTVLFSSWKKKWKKKEEEEERKVTTSSWMAARYNWISFLWCQFCIGLANLVDEPSMKFYITQKLKLGNRKWRDSEFVHNIWTSNVTVF